ncbi:hypothetical protein SUGI_0019100 [Cryptomeria japonica]|nr:hypothetical protein SUGI_0019100 [Cryptomeria japonica]
MLRGFDALVEVLQQSSNVCNGRRNGPVCLLMLEMSSAIKCPSISYHLAGSKKKVQQELAKPNVLERFINNKDDALKLRKCFAGLWSLHSNAKIIQDAITMPEAFVLKPQREGGGNNIYSKNVKKKKTNTVSFLVNVVRAYL